MEIMEVDGAVEIMLWRFEALLGLKYLDSRIGLQRRYSWPFPARPLSPRDSAFR